MAEVKHKLHKALDNALTASSQYVTNESSTQSSDESTFSDDQNKIESIVSFKKEEGLAPGPIDMPKISL